MTDVPDRLRCRYASGPMINGEPEFGYRDTGGPMEVILPTPIMREAAVEIERLQERVRVLDAALVSFTKSPYIKRQHPRRYAAALVALGRTP